MAVARRPLRNVEERLVQARAVAAVTLASLNIVDLLTTRAAVRWGADEGNPLADLLLQSGWLDVTKVATSLFLLYLATRQVRRPPYVGTICAMWAVAGVYLVAVAWNVGQLLTFAG
jgi:hypothetical protein